MAHRWLSVVALCFPLLAGAQTDLRLTEVVQLSAVLDIAHAGDGSNRLFLATKSGTIEVLQNGSLKPQPFLDIRDEVGSGAQEQGLLSLVFAPDYPGSGRFYIYYTDSGGISVLARYQVSADPDVADPGSARQLLRISQPATNHNGGRLAFGPDGFLYLSVGDGGGANDQFNQAQDTGTLLGTILRLDVSGDGPLSIPPDNPFVADAASRDEIWAYGLRNPWRITFDSLTGDLYIADVGQESVEEINVQTAAAGGGQNYGWPLAEGPGGGSGLTQPVFSYNHVQGNCSITGGQVYRGPDYPVLQGVYLYGDFCSGRVWGLSNQGGNWVNELLLDSGTIGNIVTFGEDERGNVYVSASQNFAGRIFLLSDGPVVQGGGIPIDGTLSGTWVVEGLNDQGFFVTVGENASGRFVFIAWFTFDEEGNPRWLVGVDFIEPGATSVTLVLEEVRALPFLDFSDNSATRSTFGTMTFSTVECDLIQADYSFESGATGSLNLVRLTNIEGRDCT